MCVLYIFIYIYIYYIYEQETSVYMCCAVVIKQKHEVCLTKFHIF